MSEFERKYLLRLSTQAIAHHEFVVKGKQAVTIIELLGKKGLAERIDLDGNPANADDPDAHWQITEAGLKRTGRT